MRLQWRMNTKFWQFDWSWLEILCSYTTRTVCRGNSLSSSGFPWLSWEAKNNQPSTQKFITSIKLALSNSQHLSFFTIAPRSILRHYEWFMYKIRELKVILNIIVPKQSCLWIENSLMTFYTTLQSCIQIKERTYQSYGHQSFFINRYSLYLKTARSQVNSQNYCIH